MFWLRTTSTLALLCSSYTLSASEQSLGRSLSAPRDAVAAKSSVRYGGSSGAAQVALKHNALMTGIGRALARVDAAAQSNLRGAKEAQIYQIASPSVVLIVTEDGIGSGVLISETGQIVTNWHVVGDEELVGVIFKPEAEGAEITKADLRPARVLKRDQVTDLALVEVSEVPSYAKPLKLGAMSSVPIGSDVHAIGHPTGEAWTYTRGIVSQVRRDYSWATESQVEHKATVIQTQTPINPGNSGGPLINDSLQVVGINSFSGEGEGLNFAVAADDVTSFLARKGDRIAKAVARTAVAEECEPKVLSTGRYKDPAGDSELVDLNCDGKGDAVVVVPDVASEPITTLMDIDGDDSVDIMLLDDGRDGSVDRSMHDTDDDGEVDLLGFYRNGEKEPYRIERASSPAE